MKIMTPKENRTKSYIGTFPNTTEGNAKYQETIRNIRKVVSGGKFQKMFRGPGTRSFRIWRSTITPNGFKYYSGSSHKEGATHFDGYLHYRNGKPPKFFNFELK
jgi:hypothetical protein